MGHSGQPPRLNGGVRALGPTRVGRSAAWGAYLEAMRLRRWPRSLAVLPGWVLAIVWYRLPWGTPTLRALAGAYLATLAVSVFNYVLNEVADAPYDAHHPSKQGRPVVQGRVSVRNLMGLGLGTLGLGFLVGHVVSPHAWLPLLFLAVAGVLYNGRPGGPRTFPTWTPGRKPSIRPIRFLIGWFSVVTWSRDWPSPWVLAAWAFGASLMYTKRLAEKMSLPEDLAVECRRSLGAYSRTGLRLCVLGSGLLTLGTLSGAALRLERPRLFFLLPLVALYALWIYRESTRHPRYGDEPETLFRRPAFLVLTGLVTVGALWAFS